MFVSENIDGGGKGRDVGGATAHPRDTTDAAGGDLPVAAVVAAIDALAGVDPGVVGAAGLAGAMVSLRRVQARLGAVTAALSAVFEARRVYAEDGSRSAADWIATRCRLPKGQVAGEVRLGRRLRAMPVTAAALAAGDIGVAHARRLGALAANPRTAAEFAAGEDLLVGHARSLRFDDFERTCDHWRDAVDPDGPERRRGRDEALRRVHLSPGLGGVGLLEGYLTPLAHAAVGGALERIEAELFAADWADTRARYGDAASVGLLARTGAQRRHDALVEMAQRATTAPHDGTRPRPLVSVVVGYETFAGRVCELAGGTVLAPGAVAELLADDDTLIERVVFDGQPHRRHQLGPQLPGHPAPRPRGQAPPLHPPHLRRPRPPLPGRPHPRLVRGRAHHPTQRPAPLRPPQPLAPHPPRPRPYPAKRSDLPPAARIRRFPVGHDHRRDTWTARRVRAPGG